MIRIVCVELKRQGEEGCWVQIGLGDTKQIATIDVREMPLEQRREVLAWWFNHHLHCTDGGSHSWVFHRWMPDTKAWLWGPCRKCGVYRLTQTNGNYSEWHPAGGHAQALIVNDWQEVSGKQLSGDLQDGEK